VGRDLFTTTRDEDNVAEISGDLSEWLKGEFWDISMVVRCVQQLLSSSFIPELSFL
jgi:hypothetical protein